MARLRRLVCPGLPHFIVQNSRRNTAVFVDDDDARGYADALRVAAKEAGVKVHGYSLAAQEVRVLCSPGDEGALARMMQAVGRRHVRHFNTKYAQLGSPWSGRFRSAVVDEELYLLLALRLAEGVVNGGLLAAGGAGGCIRSSLEHHLGQSADPLIIEHRLFWALGNTPFEREAAYRRWLEQPVSEAMVAAFLGAAAKGWALGSDKFIEQVGAASGRRPRPLGRGRPPGRRTRAANP